MERAFRSQILICRPQMTIKLDDVFIWQGVLPVMVSVDGGWCDWSEWGSCSVSCGAGVTARTRQCDTPVPQHGGRNCSCASKESAACSIKHCPGQHTALPSVTYSASNQLQSRRVYCHVLSILSSTIYNQHNNLVLLLLLFISHHSSVCIKLFHVH